jgi:hypothetical protein
MEKRYTLRLDDSILNEFQNYALKDDRSINGQLIYLMKKYIKESKELEKNNKDKE